MDQDQVRETLEAQISALVKSRRNSQDPDEKAAATDAIALLENEVNQLDITAADALPARVNEIIASLDEVMNARGLDAASALGRSIKKVKELTQRA